MRPTRIRVKKMSNPKKFLAPLGLAVIGALFGIGHFGSLHESFFGSDNESEIITESYYESDYDDSYSFGYSNDISFKGSGKTFVRTKYGCDDCSCSGYWGYKHTNGTYEGACSNTDMWGHKCGHGPEKHGLSKW